MKSEAPRRPWLPEQLIQNFHILKEESTGPTQSLGLKILELPTDPQTGVDMASLKKIVQKTKLAACIFVSNFNNPFGSLMPEDHKKEAVELLGKYNVPLIEDDIY